MYLDLGQRNFGRTIECRECGFIYAEGEASDEAAHRKHHKRHVQGLHVRGPLAALHVLSELKEGDTVVKLSDMDGAEAVRKLAEIKAMVDAELGHTPELPAEGVRAFLVLEQHSKRLRGCAFTEPCAEAYRVVPPPAAEDAREAGDSGLDGAPRSSASSGSLSHDGSPRPALCGVTLIWVAARDRRRGLATALLDAARTHYAAAFEVPVERLAFSQPTELGRRLAASYTGREDFLVY